MKIIRRGFERLDIGEFADRHGLTLEITKYSNVRYTASFKSVEIMHGGMLRSAYGDGTTEAAAVIAYANELSGKRIAINATNSGMRLETVVPELTVDISKLGL